MAVHHLGGDEGSDAVPDGHPVLERLEGRGVGLYLPHDHGEDHVDLHDDVDVHRLLPQEVEVADHLVVDVQGQGGLQQVLQVVDLAVGGLGGHRPHLGLEGALPHVDELPELADDAGWVEAHGLYQEVLQEPVHLVRRVVLRLAELLHRLDGDPATLVPYLLDLPQRPLHLP